MEATSSSQQHQILLFSFFLLNKFSTMADLIEGNNGKGLWKT
jgi:hypothetical protein